MKRQLLRVRNRSIMFVGNHPALFFGLVGLRKQLGQSRGLITVTQDTDLVIEGFLRSANSFATRAFLSAQPRKMIVANRTHVPATVIRAAEQNTPTLVLIREPKDAVLSYMLKKPYITAADGFREYINFYTRIAPYRDSYVVASFDEVTADFGAVIDRINRHFHTSFELFRHTDQNVRAVFSVIEKNDRATVGDDPSKISVPLAERDEIKERLRGMIADPKLRPLIEEAEGVYCAFGITPGGVGNLEIAR